MTDDDAMTVGAAASVRDALRRMDADGLGVVFVIDDDRRVLGHLTGETIGRHLRGDGDPSDPVGNAMIAGAAEGAEPPPGVVPRLDPDGRVSGFEQPALQPIPVASSSLVGNELEYLKQCIEDNWVSSTGPFVERFERAFAAYVGTEHALATSSGTTALHLALAALGIGSGDEVIIPDLTFAASANAVIHAGATPVLVDVTPDTWTIDIDAARDALSTRTRAIMPVHLYGQPADMAAVADLAQTHGLLVIEDAAEALGSTYDGRQMGQFGDAAVFSFFANKLITTGEGGMAVFRSAKTAERARILRDHGMRPGKRYWHDEVGFNYRMTNLQAAVGCAQLERVEEFLARKLEIGAAYRHAFAAHAGLTLPVVRDNVRNTYWLFTVALDPGWIDVSRDDLMAGLSRMGIETRQAFYPLHAMPPYGSFGGGRSFAVSDRLSGHGLSLPMSVTLSDEDIARVTGAIGSIFDLRGLVREYGL